MMCVTGGYRCSIRADTKFENVSFVFQHPNFYSQYMDTSVQKVRAFQRVLRVVAVAFMLTCVR
jgi:hypothetical protein